MRKTGNFGITFAAALAAAPIQSAAQTSAQPASVDDARARQEQLFTQMLQAPDDLDLMFEHALLSIGLNDFESAISTLERMLIFNPKLSRAKVELGAAYFRLGAYENARYYFEDVLANDNPPPEVQRRVNGFLDEIGRRTQDSGASVVATFGVTYSSNANLGPSSNQVFLGDNLITLLPDFVESDDIGFRASIAAQHYIDLNQPDGDNWITDANFFTLHYIDETRGDLDNLVIRTGPRLSLNEQNYGPKIRPFGYFDFVSSGNDLLYATIGFGADYTDTLSDELNLFVSAQSSWREYVDRNDFDGHTHRLTAGLAYTPEPDVTLSGIAYAETDRTDADFNSNIEFGARVGATFRYDPEFDFTDRLWSISGYVGASYRRFDEPDPQTRSAVTREDLDLRAGLSHVFHLTGGWFIQADADYLYRDSNVLNFDIDNLGVALSVGRSF